MLSGMRPDALSLSACAVPWDQEECALVSALVQSQGAGLRPLFSSQHLCMPLLIASQGAASQLGVYDLHVSCFPGKLPTPSREPH